MVKLLCLHNHKNHKNLAKPKIQAPGVKCSILNSSMSLQLKIWSIQVSLKKSETLRNC